MYKLASHDTMSYLTPKSFWLKVFHFIAKTQSLTIEEQFEKHNIRMFDIRLKYDLKTSTWNFAHGPIVFDKDVETVFKYLNSHNDQVYVRMILEYNYAPKEIGKIQHEYVQYCMQLRETYKNLILFEYRRKYDWKQLYSYEGMPVPSCYQAVSSMTLTKLDNFWPWLYARTHNKDIVAQGTDKDWLFIDFVGKYY